ncbi:NEP1-interacting protein-like 1 isoform X1 [Typha angustifolia]|uniref:NEP1-interacting protein-like 1 isoform X1 n=1 Tax=Typha angustifolia TaxID=59011 RepID=UPI003C2C44AA
MDLSSSSPAPSPATSYHSVDWDGRQSGSFGSVACEMVGRVLCAMVTCIFAIVGSVVGAVTGALIGLATESGLFRGAGIGAISGAVFSIEVVESSHDLWNSNESVVVSMVWSILYMMDIIASLLSGRLVREKVGPAVQSAVQSQVFTLSQLKIKILNRKVTKRFYNVGNGLISSFVQMSAISSPFMEPPDFFDTGSMGGMAKDSIDKLPKVKITKANKVDLAVESMCSVCLQDFQIGETVRILPNCRHTFHLPCIDGWLIRHSSCPLCRRDM